MREMADLSGLLRTLNPVLNPGEYAFCETDTRDTTDADTWIAVFREDQDLSVIVPLAESVRRGWEPRFLCRWITLSVESDLSAVGLLAAVSSALAARGIPCNVVSAVHHDHLFVPADRAEDAMAVLMELQARAADTG